MMICFLKKHKPLHKLQGRKILTVTLARISQWIWKRRTEREAIEKKLIACWMKKDILKWKSNEIVCTVSPIYSISC